MTPLVILIARFAGFTARLTGRGSGSALPGLIVEKIQPTLLEKSLLALPQGVVLITGTNGKTTTTKMVVELLEQTGLRVLTNNSGSNFTRGLLAMIVRHASLGGKLDYDIAVLELDEAYAPVIAERIKPKLVLALNVYRDQLDRYGEINTTANMIGNAMKHARFAVVNADDPVLVKTAKAVEGSGPTVGFFGVTESMLDLLPTDDELHDTSPNDRFDRPAAMVELISFEDSKVILKINGQPHSTQFQLPGVYNAANAAAAVMTVMELAPKQGVQSIVTSLANVKPAFGRGERFQIGTKSVLFGLVKNPSGFNHNLSTMLQESDTVLIAINDDYADGRDVSWLWDVHFAEHRQELHSKQVYVAGVRADDIALRLQQDDISAEHLGTDLSQALATAIESSLSSGALLLLPTYTAMLALRKGLNQYIEVPDIW